MSHDPSPLKYMGTQSQETLNMAAALAQDSTRSAELAHEPVADAGSKLGHAAHWAMDKAKGTLQSAACEVRDRATTAAETYTRKDPVRAMLVAAGAGALLMGLLAMMARSGARTVRRKIRG